MREHFDGDPGLVTDCSFAEEHVGDDDEYSEWLGAADEGTQARLTLRQRRAAPSPPHR